VKNYYSEDEIILCTYIARFGRGLLVEKKVSTFGKRPISSVQMKVQNIAAMLDEKGIPRSLDITPLSGKTTGRSGRETDWPVVEKLASMEKSEIWTKCKEILTNDR